MTVKPGFTKAKHVELWLRDLQTHPFVQRDFDKTWAAKIRDNFDPDKFGEIAAVGTAAPYNVFDGQHRLAAVRELWGEDQKVPVLLYAVLPRKQEAEMFLGRNNTKPIRALDKFRMAVVAEHPNEVAVSKLVADSGLKISKEYCAGVVRAPVALVKVYSRYGAETLTRTLEVCGKAWPNDPDTYDGSLITAIGRLLHTFGAEIDDKDLSRKLGRMGGPGRLVGTFRDAAKTLQMTLEPASVDMLVRIYNKSRKTNVLSFS